ncbi:GspH/FimT family pseudopilin [Niveibacterium microcysteis]|uniref:Type II secretion system protein H n=1 Tax=Niveibacterium microcysteis TaxID=2811415 RepID=A0ABX7M1I8_9RHOO|nr:GspH/FimT family pseudopilin [Niveibacterium microcysteis]
MAQKGFTLVELMITVTILGILLALAAPSFSDVLARQRIAGAASDLSSDLMLARIEASRRGGRVSLCPSADGVACGAVGDWSRGWIVFSDPDGDGVIAAATDIVRTRRIESPQIRIAVTGAPLSTTFQMTGRLNVARQWTVCVSGRLGRVLDARLTGVVTAYPTAAACV